MANLNPNELYYVRAYATNAVTTTYGSQVSFTTNIILPEVTTAEITEITLTTAKSGGEVIHSGGVPLTARGVVWSSSPNPTLDDPSTFDGTDVGIFESNLTDLTAGQTYYVRAYAVNSLGTAYGNEVSFVAGRPNLTTAPVTNITTTTATSGGNITSDGGAAITIRGIVWSTLQDPTLEVNEGFTEDGDGIGEFESLLTSLSLNTKYYVRAYATNSNATAYGQQVDFEIFDGKPTLTTNEVTSITATTATSGGEITSDWGSAITDRGVVWSTTENPTLEVNEGLTEDGEGIGEFESQLTGLSINTNYYVRSYATNSYGTAYGQQQEFETRDGIIYLTTNTITAIAAPNALSGGIIASDGGLPITARGIVWSTSQNPTITTNHGITNDGTGTGNFTSNLSGLIENNVYFYRAYATNAIGTCYGNEYSFTATIIPTSGLVAYYPFNDNANDESGNGLHGIVRNNVQLTSDRNENTNSAYYFSGGYSDWIEVPHNSNLNLGPNYTITAWVYKQTGSSDMVVNKGRDIACGTYILGFSSTTANASCGGSAINPDPQNLEQWYFIVSVFDGNNNKLHFYLDGNLKSTSIVDSYISNNTSSLAIGLHGYFVGGSWAYPFIGKIDDIIIYNRALSESEIQLLYNKSQLSKINKSNKHTS
jgi:hypothetical protein